MQKIYIRFIKHKMINYYCVIVMTLSLIMLLVHQVYKLCKKEIEWEEIKATKPQNKLTIVTEVFLKKVWDWLNPRGGQKCSALEFYRLCIKQLPLAGTLLCCLWKRVWVSVVLSCLKEFNFFLLHTVKGHSAHLSHEAP